MLIPTLLPKLAGFIMHGSFIFSLISLKISTFFALYSSMLKCTYAGVLICADFNMILVSTLSIQRALEASEEEV